MTEETQWRKCSHCHEVKAIESFGVKNAAKDRINPKCKQCVCDYQNQRNQLPEVYIYNKNKSQKRRAILKELPHSLTIQEWKNIKQRFNNCCFLTGKVLIESKLSIEHVIPIATGHGGHIKENVLPLDISLNMARKDKNIFEWFYTLDANEDMKRRFSEAIDYLAFMNEMSVKEYKEFVYYCDRFRRTVEEVKVTERTSRELFEEWKELARIR
ncbi:HNH endonuclease [Niallia taxi]|uniref:HNH endonuclease n=1 Tax=Niallia taxi TaxID=2499688 RepID=UPI003D2676A1